VEERQTLDAKHNGILSLFNENKERLPELESQLTDLETELINQKTLNANKIVIDMDLQRKIWKLEDEKMDLIQKIDNIKNNIEENNYMLNTGKIISNYYKIIEKEKEFASAGSDNNINKAIPSNDIFPIANNGDAAPLKKKNIMDWFSKSDNNSVPFENIETGKKTFKIVKKNTPTAINPSPSPKISPNRIEAKMDDAANPDIGAPKKILNKDEIYEKYMKVIDKNYISVNNDDVPIFDKCGLCQVEMLLNNNTGILICPNCGATENIIIDSDKPSFKEPPKEMTSFCYKRINHLNEFLAQFQAKETTDIPEDVYNEILLEIKKERITNMAHITPEKMRIILKKIKKNDYYEHIPYIINQLNGLPAPVIAPEIEEIIRGMFKAIQIPFEKYCPHKRKNFLSYNYVMYKFFELLELDEYLDCFQLLKSRTKLHQQDLIWKNICLDLNWQFIKSL
jgi:Poxvirus Late Transcription Factor VLTF3 like/A2L zinc ribbon domain